MKTIFVGIDITAEVKEHGDFPEDTVTLLIEQLIEVLKDKFPDTKFTVDNVELV